MTCHMTTGNRCDVVYGYENGVPVIKGIQQWQGELIPLTDPKALADSIYLILEEREKLLILEEREKMLRRAREDVATSGERYYKERCPLQYSSMNTKTECSRASSELC